MVAKYRKKPVVIEALQYTGNFDEIEKFVGGDSENRNGELIVATLEGRLHASNNDYIIKGVKGEFYPCKPDIFEMTYELASTSSQTTSDKWKEYQDWLNEPLELSDEEIMKGAEEWYEIEGSYKPSAIALMTWLNACKWYRNKLKNK